MPTPSWRWTTQPAKPDTPRVKMGGAGLLAKAVYQSISLVTDTPLSRASPLPHGNVRRWVTDLVIVLNCRKFVFRL
ncbi:hypothetical protein GDV60_15810 [Pseudomonas sp. DTU12.1]|nr:hypothetical protein GDV60_15810 [Pseudomonas sp. DTU12.1]